MTPGWREAAFNQGWSYRDRVPVAISGIWLSEWMAQRYRHSVTDVWRARIQAGQLDCNGQVLTADHWLSGSEQILWRRPPWREEAIPDRWDTVHDDGDLLVINKPSGLPVIPGGGFLRHTLTALLETTGARPVHRLGRFTSGLQVCARNPSTRAVLSRHFRPEGGCCKVYQAWTYRVLGLELGQLLLVTSDVVERPHPLLGWIWGPEQAGDDPVRKRFAARSQIRLLERHVKGDLLAVTIETGRPHQIRIHCAQLGSPLLGDPLYSGNQEISATATPGDGGYRLHAWKLIGLHRVGAGAIEASPPAGWNQA